MIDLHFDGSPATFIMIGVSVGIAFAVGFSAGHAYSVVRDFWNG